MTYSRTGRQRAARKSQGDMKETAVTTRTFYLSFSTEMFFGGAIIVDMTPEELEGCADKGQCVIAAVAKTIGLGINPGPEHSVQGHEIPQDDHIPEEYKNRLLDETDCNLLSEDHPPTEQQKLMIRWMVGHLQPGSSDDLEARQLIADELRQDPPDKGFLMMLANAIGAQRNKMTETAMTDTATPLVTAQPSPPEGNLPWRIVAGNGEIISEIGDRETAERLARYCNDAGHALLGVVEEIRQRDGVVVYADSLAEMLVDILQPPPDDKVN